MHHVDVGEFVEQLRSVAEAVAAGSAELPPGARKGLFVATSQVTADAAEYFGLPREGTLIVGSQITV